MSHAELDEASELNAVDPADPDRRYAELRRLHPHLSVLGGCCGTNHFHIDAISTLNWAGERTARPTSKPPAKTPH